MPHALVFDIGGGSTELVWLRARGRRGAAARSSASSRCRMASSRLADRYGGRDVSRGDLRRHGRGDARRRSRRSRRVTRIAPRVAAGQVQMLGSSGTVTTLAGVHLELPRYDRAPGRRHGARFRRHRPRLAPPRRPDLGRARARIPASASERADLVLAGCAILEAICRALAGRPAASSPIAASARASCWASSRAADDGAARPCTARERRRSRGARQDRAQRTPPRPRWLAAPAQRSLCRRGASAQGYRSRAAFKLHRARRPLPSPAAGRARRRSRRGARRLDPGRGRRGSGARQGQGRRRSICWRWSRCRARSCCSCDFSRPRRPAALKAALGGPADVVLSRHGGAGDRPRRDRSSAHRGAGRGGL